MEIGKYARRVRWFCEFVRWRSKVAFRYARAWCHTIAAGKKIYIGITGSAGKTTTKDIVVTILAQSAPTAGTQRSINSVADLPDQVASVQRHHRFCVIEVSANRPGAFDWPLRLIRPRVGALTNVGRDHYKAFKSVDAIAEEKAKLIFSLPRDGTAVLNIDDERVRRIGERAACNVIWVGRNPDADIQLLDVRSRWPAPLVLRVQCSGKTFEVETRLHGKHMAYSILHALGIALSVGIEMEEAIAGIKAVEPTEGRMQVVEGGDEVVFVRDDWKAPEWSSRLALEFLSEAAAPRKVAVIGSLSDFSGDSSTKYRTFARDIGLYCDLAVFVGPNAHRAMRARKRGQNCTLVGFPNVREASAYLRQKLRAGDLVLLKGSNKADHLVRLMLDRYKPVECWLERCGRDSFCTRCSRLYQPVGNPAEEGDRKTQMREASRETPMFAESSSFTEVVVAGLGNPESGYADTVHNVGHRVLDRIADRQGVEWVEGELGSCGRATLEGGSEVLLFKPDAPMNRNGEALARFLVERESNPEHCVIIHDDTDIEFGRVKFKREGGDGGHRGIRSAVRALGTDEVGRIRVGVRRPDGRAGGADRVLDRFSAVEESEMESVLDEAASVLASRIATLVVTR